jgi:hypothetical protein
MIVTLPADAAVRLAELARLEAERHPPRTRERRAAAHLWQSLGAGSVDAAKRAIATFGTPEAQAGAMALLGHLAAQLTATTKEQP